MADPFSGGFCNWVAANSTLLLAGGANADSSATLAVSSDDGSTWDSPASDPFSGGGGQARVVLATDSLLVAGGQNGPGSVTVATSTDDGSTWNTPVSDPFGGSTSSFCFGLAINSSLLLAGGQSAGTATVATSTDSGSVWSSPAVDPFGSGGVCNSVAATDSLLLAGGTNAGHTASLAVSTDGTVWTAPLTNPFPGGECDAVAMTSSLLLAGGFDTLGTHTLAVSTNSGVTWTSPASDPFSGGFCLAVIATDSLLVAGGANGDGSVTVAYSTDNGVTWSTPGTNPFSGGVCTALAMHASTILAGGNNEADTTTLAVSVDGGSSWDSPATDPFSGGQVFSGAATSSLLLAGGENGDSSVTVSVSTDGGVTWSGTGAPVDATATATAPVIPLIPTTATATGGVSHTATGEAPIIPFIPTTAVVTKGAPILGGGTVLPLIPTSAAVSADVTSQEATGTAPVLPLIPVTASVVLTTHHAIIPSTDDGYAYLARNRGFRAVPNIIVPVSPPPTSGTGGNTQPPLGAPTQVPITITPIPRVSETFDAPVVIGGIPYADAARAPWLPASVARSVWANQLQVVVDGQDVTWFRGVPTVVSDWSSQEPFADASASFLLPAVTAFDALPAAPALPTGEVVGIAGSYTGNGYWQASAEGLITAYGDAASYGDPLGLLAQPVSGIASHPTKFGYVMVARDGGAFCFGGCPFEGSLPGSDVVPAAPIIAIALTATGNGYWMLGADGGVFSFGDAVFHGSAFGDIGYPTNQATGICRSHGGAGYVIVTTNGNVKYYGDATNYGTVEAAYEAPFVAIASSPTLDGYVIINTLGAAYCLPDTTGKILYRGGASSLTLAQPMNSVWVTADAKGYWMSAGDGGVFTFGDAPFFGSVPGGGTTDWGSLSWLRLAAPVTFNRIDSSGNPHTLWEGIVADWEDTTSAGGDIGLVVQCTGCLFQGDWYVAKPIVDLPFVGYDPTSGQPIFGWDTGLAIASAFNSCHDPSAGTALGNGPRPTPPQPSPANFGTCQPVTTGILTVTQPAWDKLLSSYLTNILAQAQLASGAQWTVGIARPRTPVIIEKNVLGVDWTVHTGGHGISEQVSYDQSTAVTATYGQGQSPPVLAPAPIVASSDTEVLLSGSWANSRYPQVPPATPGFPLGSGQSFSPGDGQTGLLPFSNWMRQSGYPLVSGNTYLAVNASSAILDFYLIQDWQQNAGLEVTGLIDAATWDAAFGNGQNEGAVNNVFYMPLWQLPEVEPYTYTPSGSPTGTNPFYNPRIPRIERFESMGQQLTKAQGIVSARVEGERIQTPAWVGTITLTADPIEGSRFDTQAGQNILLRFFHGRDTLFHISAVSVDFKAMTVALTVASQAYDLQTLASIWARDTQAHGVARSGRPNLVNLNIASNTTVFDAESSAGRVAPITVPSQGWAVARVPFSESGSVAVTNFTSSPPTQFAMGVFSGPVSPSDVANAIGPQGPLLNDPAGNNPWNDYTTTGANGGQGLASLGLLYAAGGPQAPCGYYPSDPNGTQVLTGDYLDSQTWPYAPAPGNVPWMWVAFYATEECTISGRFLVAPGN